MQQHHKRTKSSCAFLQQAHARDLAAITSPKRKDAKGTMQKRPTKQIGVGRAHPTDILARCIKRAQFVNLKPYRQASRIHRAVGASTEPNGSLALMKAKPTWQVSSLGVISEGTAFLGLTFLKVTQHGRAVAAATTHVVWGFGLGPKPSTLYSGFHFFHYPYITSTQPLHNKP